MNHYNKESQLKRAISANPLLPITILFAIGIVAIQSYNSLIIPIIAASVAIIAGLLKRTVLAAWCVAFALGAITMLLSGVNNESNNFESIYENRYYEATIENAIEYDNTQSATITIVKAGDKPENLKECNRISARFVTPSFNPSLLKGYSIVFYGSLEPIISTTDLPDEWTPEQSLLNKNINLRTFVEPDKIVTCFPTEGMIPYLQRCRNTLMDHLFQTNLSSPAKEFLATALLGDGSGLSQSIREEFADAGLSHILALSGLHVGLIAMIVSFALWPVRTFGYRKTTSIAIIIILWIYAATTGFSASVIRATVMMTIYLIGQMLQRPSSPLNSLSAAALIILTIEPTSLFTIGFQLSFTAVLSIILFADKINPFSRRRRIAYTIASYPAITISAMIGTGLISAFYFHRFPLYFIFSNIVASIFLPIIIAGGVVILFISLFGSAPTLLTTLVSTAYSWLENIAGFFAKLPGATIDNVYLPSYVILLYIVVIATTILWINKKRRTYGMLWGLAVILFAWVMIFPPRPVREPRLFIARTTFHTDMIIDNATDTLYIFTTRPQEPINVTGRAHLHYKDYMGMRNIREIKMINSPDTTANGFSINHNNIRWGSKKITVFSDRYNEANMHHADYALVCRGYRNTIGHMRDCINCDTIIFSYDIDPRRSKRYIDECNELKLPYINLREVKWSLPYISD